MTVTIMVIVILAIFNILTLLLTFGVYVIVLNTKFHTSQVQNAMTVLVNKTLAVESTLSKLTSSFTEYIEIATEVADKISMIVPEEGQVYRTMDGAYSATSLDELINKIKKDGKVEKYLSEDMDQLTKLFEEDMSDDDDDDEEE
jgi:arsenate reductase-like glutaredoxin family protein